MNLQNLIRKTARAVAVGSGAVLGRRRILTKSINNSAGEGLRIGFELRAVNDPCVELAEMLNYPGPIAVLVEALKREGVGFDESCFPNENITHQNPYVAIIRGEAAEFLHRACKSIESRRAGEQMRQSNLCVVKLGGAADSCALDARNQSLHVGVKGHSLPNDPKLSHADGRAAPLAR
jgi:hypothetical protein